MGRSIGPIELAEYELLALRRTEAARGVSLVGAPALTLLSNTAATGSTVAWPGGRGTVTVAGTIGGATLTLQYLGPDGTTWVAAGSATTFTAAGAANFEAAQGSIRMLVAGGAPSGLYATATRYTA